MRRLLLVLGACGASSRATDPGPAKPLLAVAPADATEAPRIAPDAAVAPDALVLPSCLGLECLVQARAAWKRHDRGVAILIANTACTGGEPQACLLAADYVDETPGSRLAPAELRTRGIAGLEDACDKDRAEACLLLGRLRLHGRHGTRDPVRGKVLVTRACDLGSADACVVLASGEPDAKRTLALLERGCKGGSQNACVAVGDRILAGDRPRARKMFQAACEANVAAGCLAEGREQRRAKQPALAATAFEKGCGLEPGASCVEAGKLAEPTQPGHTRDLYAEACDDNYGAACVELGLLIAGGKGGDRDWGAAIRLYHKACELETPGACEQELRAKAHPPDWRCATEAACTKLCDETIAKSCTKLGELVSATGDCEAGTAQYIKACGLGDGRGCRLAANHSGDPDIYNHGCDAGDVESCVLRDVATYRGARNPEGLKALHDACTAQRGDACVWYWDTLDDPPAILLLQTACDRKDARACRFLASHLGVRTTPGGSGTCCSELAESEIKAERAQAKRGTAALHRACVLGDRRSCAVEREGSSLGPACPADDLRWEW